MLLNRPIFSHIGIFCVLFFLVLASCSTYGVRKSSPGNFGSSSSSRTSSKAPLEIKSEEVLPYTAKLTYGEICFNSKRYGRQVCFPCYKSDKGGCDAAVEDLVDKAIACSTTIGPSASYERTPTYNFPSTPISQPNYNVGQFSPPTVVPNVYPNYTR